MRSQNGIEGVAIRHLSQKNLRLKSCKMLKSLWAGYGHICHLTAEGTATAPDEKPKSLMMKYITPPVGNESITVEEGHIRKVLSYQIEKYFYTQLVPRMPSEIGVPTCISAQDSDSDGNALVMIITDLRETFPVAGETRSELNKDQTYAVLDWLSSFHGFWWSELHRIEREGCCRPPLEHFENYKSTSLQRGGVWLNGGYTCLATRQSEYARLRTDKDSEWSLALCQPIASGMASVGECAAQVLAPSLNIRDGSPNSPYITLLHGDVKSENLCTTLDGKKAAFFDFQYVGLGLGVCDLAKLFTCSVPLRLLDEEAHDAEVISMSRGEKELLHHYHQKLVLVSGKQYEWNLFVRHWETALVDWLRFQACWGFWGNTEWLEGRVRSILKDEEWRQWVIRAISPS